MSIEALLLLVTHLCSSAPTPEARYECKEAYVNCAVKLSGSVMDYADFKEACLSGRYVEGHKRRKDVK